MSGANGARTVSLTAAAKALSISRATAYEAVRRGDFPVEVIRAGRSLRVPKAALDRVLGESDTPEPLSALVERLMDNTHLDRASRMATLALLVSLGRAAESEIEKLVKETPARGSGETVRVTDVKDYPNGITD